MKILVTDDAVFMRTILRGIIEGAGHTVVEAGNGNELVEAYKKENPDLVFLDITMPDCDGLQGLGKLIKLYPKAKVIMCSAMGQQAMVLEAIQLGAKDFIVKPFQKERILDTLKKWGI